MTRGLDFFEGRGSRVIGDLGQSFIFLKSGWRRLMMKFFSCGTRALGTARMGEARDLAQVSPIFLREGGAGLWFQRLGSFEMSRVWTRDSSKVQGQRM